MIKKINIKDIFNIVVLFIIALLLSFDLFTNKGQPATFDGPTHLTNIAMFYKSMKQGEWHVTWTDGFANYGMPLGLMAQQTTSYLGAVLNFAFNNVVLSYNFVVFLGAFLSVLFFYIFLRLYFNPESALIGTFLFNFAPYRILNVYVRGALPEFFASLFIPLILIGAHFLIKKRQPKGFFLIVLSTALLILTHPFMFVVGSFVFLPFIIFHLIKSEQRPRMIFILLSAFILGITLTGYYFFPLSFELKYFYYGLQKNHLVSNHFLSWGNYLIENWPYFYKGDIFTRGHLIISGFLETMILIVGLIISLKKCLKRSLRIKDWLFFTIVSVLVVIIFTTKLTNPIYQRINLLSGIQHPWRMLSAFIFFPPMILAYLNNKFSHKLFFYLIIVVVCITRFPQLYGKNYTFYPENHYFFTKENLHGNILNTVWTGPTQDYPVKKQKAKIIEGDGKILQEKIKNSKREYLIEANSDIRMADYTFYFPGWRVYVNGKETTVQFQDPAYRGVITYNVPKGKHEILVKFSDTKARIIGKIITAVSMLIFSLIFILRKKLKYVFKE